MPNGDAPSPGHAAQRLIAALPDAVLDQGDLSENDVCLSKKDKTDRCSKDQAIKPQPRATAITNTTLDIQNACQSILATPTSAMKLTGMNVNS